MKLKETISILEVYKLDSEFDRICFDLKRNIDSIFSSFQKRISNVSVQVDALDEIIVRTDFNTNKPRFQTHSNLKIYQDKIEMLKERGFASTLKYLIEALADELEIKVSTEIDTIEISRDYTMDVYELIADSLKFHFLRFNTDHIRIKLYELNRMVILRIELRDKTKIAKELSKLELFLKSRMEVSMDRLNAILNEEQIVNDYRSVYNFPLKHE